MLMALQAFDWIPLSKQLYSAASKGISLQHPETCCSSGCGSHSRTLPCKNLLEWPWKVDGNSFLGEELFYPLYSGETPITVVRFETYKTLYYRLSPATVQEA